jgi:3-phenylpropionate/trans-cinnamate dioxygenase ferredoxin subunit
VTFERACALDEVETDEALAVTIGRYEVAVARQPGPGEKDEVFAFENICSHAAVALSEGVVEDCTVECWLHGSRFDLRTGKPTGLPATEPIATFPAEIRDVDGSAEVWVDVDTTLNGVTPQ